MTWRLTAPDRLNTPSAQRWPDEGSQRVYMTAISIYHQSRTERPTGTFRELTDEVAEAVERGWL